MQTNKVTLIGYVGNQLKTKKSINGVKRTSIRLATHFSTRSKDQQVRWKTTWHDVVAWDQLASFAETSFVIGSRIMVEGMIEYKTYTDYSGHIRYITIITAKHLMNLDR